MHYNNTAIVLHTQRGGAEEPGHYGKLDHSGKKTATVAPAVGEAEYGKLDRVSHTSMHCIYVITPPPDPHLYGL